MVATPCEAAFSWIAAPDSESRLTIASTVTPSAIMPSAMVVIFSASPSAFWMSYSTPAASKAASSSGRSAVSQRTEDSVSGRMTPILPAASPLPVSPPSSPPSLLSSPHAVSARAKPSTPTAAKLNFRCTRTASCWFRCRV